MIAYTVKEVAKMSGVSVRTLRYYDEIGLLKPAYYGDNGYRYYEEEQLLRLQQILFFRELEIPLSDIQMILDSSRFDQIQALNTHKKLLRNKLERLQTLLETIDKTIHHLKGEFQMSHEEMYQGFDKEKEEKYVEELKKLYGEGSEKYIRESIERTKKWGKEDWEQVKTLSEEIHQEMVQSIEQGKSADHPDVQAIVRKHYKWVNLFYTPTKEVYMGLGDLYVQHPDFRKLYDSYHPQLAEFMREAIQVFAQKNLA